MSEEPESPELKAAYENLVRAATEYGRLAPDKPRRTDPPQIEPTLLHASPDNFYPGVNMMLDSGGYMPGKIPVVVVPIRSQDLRKYRRRGYTADRLMRELLLVRK